MGRVELATVGLGAALIAAGVAVACWQAALILGVLLMAGGWDWSKGAS